MVFDFFQKNICGAPIRMMKNGSVFIAVSAIVSEKKILKCRALKRETCEIPGFPHFQIAVSPKLLRVDS